MYGCPGAEGPSGLGDVVECVVGAVAFGDFGPEPALVVGYSIRHVRAANDDEISGEGPETFSLLRGALVGGATAAWVSFPDDVEPRVSRSLAVAAEWYRNHLNYGQTVAAIAADKDVHTSQLEHIEGRAAEVRALRSSRPQTTFKMTTVIETVNAELWPDDEARALQTKALWQAGGGDAHALGWSILSRTYEMTPLGDGMGAFVGKPSDRDVADAYLCAYDFVAFGFHRLDELSRVMDPSAG